MRFSLDEIFAFHCAPTFAGIKQANLISFSTKEKDYIDNELYKYNSLLNIKGIYFKKLYSVKERNLILVYRKKELEKKLNRVDVSNFLQKYGYSGNNVESYLSRLSERLSTDGYFPHEIGIFLGYPLVDVCGFIDNNGQNFLICGYWKVYDDLEITNGLFKMYTNCRTDFYNKFHKGFSIEQLCVS